MDKPERPEGAESLLLEEVADGEVRFEHGIAIEQVIKFTDDLEEFYEDQVAALSSELGAARGECEELRRVIDGLRRQLDQRDTAVMQEYQLLLGKITAIHLILR